MFYGDEWITVIILYIHNNMYQFVRLNFQSIHNLYFKISLKYIHIM